MREKAANEAKSEFMSLMCHEVRTPLNGCLASAEMLLETPLLDEQRELTNTIRISGSILLSTVSNFLDFFKVQAGKPLDIVRTPFHIVDLVADVHCIIEAMMGPQHKVSAQYDSSASQEVLLRELLLPMPPSCLLQAGKLFHISCARRATPWTL
jgi:signal transduction histidine kinase